MRGVMIVAVLIGVSGGLASRAARAAEAGPVRVGLVLVPAPLGVLDADVWGANDQVGSVPAFGVMPTVDVTWRHGLFTGVATNLTFNIRARGAQVDPGRAVDLLLRLGASAAVARRAQLYGYLAPGYSFTSGFPGDAAARGPVVGLHAGAMLDVTPRIFLTVELGWQQGFQRATIDGQTGRFSASFLQGGLGAGARI